MNTDAIKLLTLKEGHRALICYPYAGGNVSSYVSFIRYLPDAVGLYVFDLHTNDCGTTGQTIQSVAAACAKYLEQFDNKPMAIFGHSMGALLAYESIRDKELQHAQHLFVSGHVPPHIKVNEVKRYELDDRALINLIAEMSGTSPALLAAPEFLEMLLPVVRQDFQLCDEYGFTEASGYSVSCPMTVFSGDDDPRMPSKKMAAWKNYTNNSFDHYAFSGGHFFIREHIKTITEIMMRKLQWQ